MTVVMKVHAAVQRMTRVVKAFQKHPSSGQFTGTKSSIQFMHKL